MRHKTAEGVERAGAYVGSASWHTRVAAVPLHVSLGIPFSTERLEANGASTRGRRRWRHRNHVACVLRSVTVHRQDVVGRPARWATAATADELHGDPESFWATELRAAFAITLARELCFASIWTDHALQGARCHETRALRVFVQLPA